MNFLRNRLGIWCRKIQVWWWGSIWQSDQVRNHWSEHGVILDWSQRIVLHLGTSDNMQKHNRDEYIAPRLNSTMSNRGEFETVHHRLCRSRGGSNEWVNKIKLYASLHEARHRVFGNGTVDEQLMQLLDIRWPWLSREFRQDILNILKETDAEYYYERGVMKPK